MKKTSQCDKVIEYIKKHGSITQVDAHKLGCWRLASRISDLRRKGYAIKVEKLRIKKSDGGYAPIARYSLMEESECS